jgi:predicted phosphodiesterase
MGIGASDIRQITRTIQRNRCRPKDGDGRAGGLVEIRSKIRPIIAGDLHACTQNLKAILAHGGNERKIKDGSCLLILLGDTVHEDRTGRLKETMSSLEILEYIFGLFKRHGNRIIYLRGNHDSFDDRLVKSGIQQGLEFRRFVQRQRGQDYLDAAQEFFEALPMFVIGPHYAITHAGPVRGGMDREELINVRRNVDEYMQLMWNRINEFRGTPTLKEYDESDIRRTLERLRMPSKTHFIVGHNPLWTTGNRTGVWLNVLGIENHHILYSGPETRAPYITFHGSKLAVEYAIAEKSEAVYA